jgi:hypothetical protein
MFIKFGNSLLNTDYVKVFTPITDDSGSCCLGVLMENEERAMIEKFENEESRSLRFKQICKMLSEK